MWQDPAGVGSDHHLALFIAEHVTPHSDSLRHRRFKADFLRCINTAPCGSFEQDSCSDAAVRRPACSIYFTGRDQNVPSLAGKSRAGFWQKGSWRWQVLGYEWLHI